jgi:hypothetical protein
LFGLGRFFSFFILYTVGRIPSTMDQPVARPPTTHRTTQTQNKLAQYRHPCLRGSVVGWGTILQARWSPVPVPDEVDFFNLPNPSSRTMALGVDSASNRNVPGIFIGVKGGRRVGLTTLPPSVSRMSENVWASTSRNPKGLHGLYRIILPLPFPLPYFRLYSALNHKSTYTKRHWTINEGTHSRGYWGFCCVWQRHLSSYQNLYVSYSVFYTTWYDGSSLFAVWDRCLATAEPPDRQTVRPTDRSEHAQTLFLICLKWCSELTVRWISPNLSHVEMNFAFWKGLALRVFLNLQIRNRVLYDLGRGNV